MRCASCLFPGRLVSRKHGLRVIYCELIGGAEVIYVEDKIYAIR